MQEEMGLCCRRRIYVCPSNAKGQVEASVDAEVTVLVIGCLGTAGAPTSPSSRSFTKPLRPLGESFHFVRSSMLCACRTFCKLD
jgi:hypothetical protein